MCALAGSGGDSGASGVGHRADDPTPTPRKKAKHRGHIQYAAEFLLVRISWQSRSEDRVFRLFRLFRSYKNGVQYP
jgi:hypothetical protein